jgi:hypothetical protein
VLALLVQAAWMWFKFRYAERSAAHARRLLDATAPSSAASKDTKTAGVLAFKPRGAVPSTSQGGPRP